MLMALASALLMGCGAGKTLVMRPPEAAFRASSVEIIEATPNIKVPEKARRTFKDKLERFIFAEGGLEKGPGLKISYRFIQFETGNQFTRWFWGGIGNAGEGSMTVEAKYYDGRGKSPSYRSRGRSRAGPSAGISTSPSKRRPAR